MKTKHHKKQFRNSKGQFDKWPIGNLCYLTKTDSSGGYYGSGHYIIVGSGKRGVVNLIPATDDPCRLHEDSLEIGGKHIVSDMMPLESHELTSHAMRIREVIERNFKGDPYYSVGLNAASKLENCARYIRQKNQNKVVLLDERLNPASDKYDPLSVIKSNHQKRK
jgi:hypothetical protein